ncbi:hypothetical protein [Enterococcus sp. DIV0210g]|jgi:hypothetical protein|uniref:hypothetical protein n=1 Tax=Enterococcus sp. DIV0210g TaxID=2774656 RepID=UPI003D2FD2A2
MLRSSKNVLHLVMSAMLAGSIGLEAGVTVAAETAADSAVFPAVKSPEAESELSYQADRENKIVNWTLKFKKIADPEVLRQMQFKLTDKNDQTAVVDFGEEDQTLEGLKDDWIGIGSHTNTEDQATIHFQTKIPEDAGNYTLKLWTRLSEQQDSEPEKIVPIGDSENVTYSIDFPNETEESVVETSTENQTESASESTVSSVSGSNDTETETNSSENDQIAETSETTSEAAKETTAETKAEKQKAAVSSRSARSVIPQSLTGAGLSSIPFGAKKLTGLFAEVNQNGGQGSGAVKPQNPVDGTNDNRPYDMVELSGSKNWLSIWSNESSKLNFNSNFKGRTYIKFDKANSDGLAFVMHNDSRKTTAITQAQRSSDGQNLGVYGTNNGRNKGPQSEAVQNSVAVEFDMKASLSNTQANALDSTGGHAFDIGTGVTDSEAAHMAYSFPGNPNTYVPLKDNAGDTSGWTAFPAVVRNARVRHYSSPNVEGVQSLSGISSGWYEFRFNYTVGAGMTYYLVNPANGSQTTPVTIGESELRTNLALASNNNQAYWGFTAANGSAQGTTDFVFTETPSDAQLDLINDVKDTNNQSVQTGKDTPLTDKYITSASPANFETVFHLKESERTFSLSKWTGKVDPTYYDIPVDGTIKVSYKIDDGVLQETSATIDPNGNIALSLSGVTINKGQKVTFTTNLPTKKSSGDHQTSFYSQLTGKYGTDTTETSVESTSIYFWIKNAPIAPNIKRLAAAPSDQLTDFVDTFGLQFDYEDLDAASNELNYEITINGKSAGKGTLADAIATNQQWSDTGKIDLLSSGFYHRGENIAVLKITDANGLSDEETITFNVAGYKGFEIVTENYDWSFDKTQLPDEKTAQNRLQDMTIKGRDTTQDNSTAKIVASATDIVNEKGTVISKENFTFKDSGTEQPLANQQLSLNETHAYSSSEGLLLSLSDQNDTGQYKGTITWTISDAP